MTRITTIGIDLAKKVFQVHGVDAEGKVVVARKLRRKQVLAFFAKAGAVSGRHGGLRQCALLGA
jgi:transposase